MGFDVSENGIRIELEKCANMRQRISTLSMEELSNLISREKLWSGAMEINGGLTWTKSNGIHGTNDHLVSIWPVRFVSMHPIQIMGFTLCSTPPVSLFREKIMWLKVWTLLSWRLSRKLKKSVARIVKKSHKLERLIIKLTFAKFVKMFSIVQRSVKLLTSSNIKKFAVRAKTTKTKFFCIKEFQKSWQLPVKNTQLSQPHLREKILISTICGRNRFQVENQEL